MGWDGKRGAAEDSTHLYAWPSPREAKVSGLAGVVHTPSRELSLVGVSRQLLRGSSTY
jgi:hypothetical protein